MAHSAVVAPSGGQAGILRWLAESRSSHPMQAQRVPLRSLRDWRFESDTGNFRHRTGRFFSIEGVSVVTNHGSTAHWMQPIVDQPETGILGFLAGYKSGILHVLVQRKMEPGNINMAQLSPTVQATRSNYTCVHGGMRPAYVDYFISPSPGSVLVDQIQTEQASRYIKKENRNMVVQVDPDDVPADPDYRWMTLGELLALAPQPDVLNFDTRSVLSCISFARHGAATTESDEAPFPVRVLGSLTTDCDDDRLRLIRTWLAQHHDRFFMTTGRVPLRHVAGWTCNGDVIAHESGKFFEVVGVSVEASTREVSRWDQPLVRSVGQGIVGFLCQHGEGVLRFLVRAVLEPGVSSMRLGPTLHCIPGNHDVVPPFFAEISHATGPRVRFSSIQSEEGGRFYHDQRLLTVVEFPPDERIECPTDYCWMTLREIKEMILQYGAVSVEARSLIACLPLST